MSPALEWVLSRYASVIARVPNYVNTMLMMAAVTKARNPIENLTSSFIWVMASLNIYFDLLSPFT